MRAAAAMFDPKMQAHALNMKKATLVTQIKALDGKRAGILL